MLLDLFRQFLRYSQTLVEHWNGVQWSVVPSQNVNPIQNNHLYDVSALASNDIWAVGSHGSPLTLVEHWDGVQWSIIPTSDPPGANNNWLNGVSAIASNDVWMVGSFQSQIGASSTLTYHWNGSQINRVPSPNYGPSFQDLFDVTAISPTDIWAVGYYCCDGSGPSLNLALHWNGSQWSITPSPNPGQFNNSMEGVAALSSTDVWVAGYMDSCSGGPCSWRTLTEHYSDPCSTPSPSPTPSSTPSPTQTPSPSALLVGHVSWQGIAQPTGTPDPRNVQGITLTLRFDGATDESEYTGLSTDASGYFTVTVDTLPSGTYDWRTKGLKNLATAGTLSLPGGPGTTQAEMGEQPAGDAMTSGPSNFNVVNTPDFTTLKATFGRREGEPGYDWRADFNGDGVVSSADFTLLRANFGHHGADPIEPARR